MKVLFNSLLIVTLSLAGGCQQLKWVNLDGSSVNETGLEKAKKACRVGRKLEALERARDERDDDLARANSNEAKMLVKDDFAAVERQVYKEIDICMHRQGYKRPS